MAWRIHDLVVEGELDNTKKGIVKGWIQFSDRPDQVRLFLKGNCHPDLAGWKFRIKRLRSVPEWADPVDSSDLAAEQSGPAGDITADQTLKDSDCSVDEFLARIRAGEPPPYILRKALYLEWYSSRNGRVVIQDTRLGVERLGERAFELTGEDLKRAAREAERERADLEARGVVIETEVMEFPSYWPGDDDLEEMFGPEVSRICLDPGAGPLDEALRQLAGFHLRSADSTTVSLEIEEEIPGLPLPQKRRRKIRELFDPPLSPPSDQWMSDERAVIERRKLELLLITKGIRINVCEHFDPRFAFEWAGMCVLWENVPKELTEDDLAAPVVYNSSDNCDRCRQELGDQWRAPAL